MLYIISYKFFNTYMEQFHTHLKQVIRQQCWKYNGGTNIFNRVRELDTHPQLSV